MNFFRYFILLLTDVCQVWYSASALAAVQTLRADVVAVGGGKAGILWAQTTLYLHKYIETACHSESKERRGEVCALCVAVLLTC